MTDAGFRAVNGDFDLNYENLNDEARYGCLLREDMEHIQLASFGAKRIDMQYLQTCIKYTQALHILSFFS